MMSTPKSLLSIYIMFCYGTFNFISLSFFVRVRKKSCIVTAMYFTRPANPGQLSRHTLTTRLLYTVIPSENYAPKGRTLDCLLSALVDDLSHLSRDGVEAMSWIWVKMAQ